MTQELFKESLRSLLRREPFEPFTVELAGGERFVVDRPDAVSLGGGAAGFIAEDGTIHLFDWQKTRHLGREVNGASP
jgi:hypothetical protein